MLLDCELLQPRVETRAGHTRETPEMGPQEERELLKVSKSTNYHPGIKFEVLLLTAMLGVQEKHGPPDTVETDPTPNHISSRR